MQRDYRNLIFFTVWAALIAGFEFFIWRPNILWWMFADTLIVLLVIQLVMSRLSKTGSSFLAIAIFPALAATAMYASSVLPTDRGLVHVIGVLVALMIARYIKQSYVYLLKPSTYRIGSLEYLSDYGNLLVIFLLSASLYGFKAYINTPIWLVISSLVVVISLVLYNFFWSNKFEWSEFRPHLLAGVLVLTEIAWALTYLPFDYLSTGLLLTVTYYVIVHLQKLHLQDKLTKDKVRAYLAFIIISYILIFLSVRWL